MSPLVNNNNGTALNRPEVVCPLIPVLVAFSVFVFSMPKGSRERVPNEQDQALTRAVRDQRAEAVSLGRLGKLTLAAEMNRRSHPQGISNPAEYYRKVWLPFETKVREVVRGSTLRNTDPVGAVKEAMFQVLGTNLCYNSSCDSPFDLLDPNTPRGQSHSFTQAAKLLLTSSRMVTIPGDMTVVVVYTDTHEFLGSVQNGILTTHEFATRGNEPCIWGPLDQISGVEMRVVPLDDSLRSALAGEMRTRPLLDTVKATVALPTPNDASVVGASPAHYGHNVGNRGSTNRVIHDPYAFSSGKVRILEGDLEIPNETPRNPQEYARNSAGVFSNLRQQIQLPNHSVVSPTSK